MESTNSALSSALSSLVSNFEAADTNKDGKVSAQEAASYAQQSSGTRATDSTSNSSGSDSDSQSSSSDDSARILMHIRNLMQAYHIGAPAEGGGQFSVSV